jgi:PAS domain-containing protein
MEHLLQPADFEIVFDRLPGMCLLLDISFRILAQNRAHAEATLTDPKATVGRFLFEVFPDNPGDSGADGLSELRRSLTKVLKTRAPDPMPLLKYDIKSVPGKGVPYEMRYWRVVNTPILGEDGFVRLIINNAEDVTALMR